MSDVWNIIAPVLLYALATAALFLSGAIGYYKIVGAAFWDRKTSKFQAEETERKAKELVLVATDNMALKIDPIAQAVAKLEKDKDIQFDYIRRLQSDILETKFSEQKQAQDFTSQLAGVTAELKTANSQISEMAEG